MKFASTFFGIAIAASLLTAACSGGDAAHMPPDAIAMAGNRVLTRTEVVSNIPAGLPEADSTLLAKAYIRNWIETELIDRIASEEVDIDEINRLTAQYRRELIMAQYRRAMAAKAGNGVFPADSLKAFYEAHKSDFMLDRPLVKGIYIKVPADAKNLRLLRRLFNSAKPDDIDRLEKEASKAAIHYDYFRDRWIDWEQIETRIPLKFTGKELAACAAGKPVDVEVDGFVYLLSVADYLPAGSPMPFEAAEPLISERMLNIARLDYDRKLRNDLINNAISDGTLQFNGQNPLK